MTNWSGQAQRLGRRRFLQAGLAGAAAGSILACGRSGGGASWRFFSGSEAKTVAAICDQIIPADDAPGASEAGVVDFIDLQLSGHYRKHQAAYRNGLAEVDTVSRKRFGKVFSELSLEQQTEILFDLEGNENEFFRLIRTHAMQGFYGDPRHGGNRGAASWKMVALPDPPVRGRVPYKRKRG